MNKEEIFSIIKEHVCEVIPELEGHDFKPTDQLKELGANSIDRVEIVTMVLESLSLDIPRVELYKVNNLGELAELLYEKS